MNSHVTHDHGTGTHNRRSPERAVPARVAPDAGGARRTPSPDGLPPRGTIPPAAIRQVEEQRTT